MDLLTKLPEMSDDALANLRTNAKRLQQSGTPAQRTDAAALLPAVEAEIGARRLAKVKATRSAARGKGTVRDAKRRGECRAKRAHQARGGLLGPAIEGLSSMIASLGGRNAG